jgi:hypothetical protein
MEPDGGSVPDGGNHPSSDAGRLPDGGVVGGGDAGTNDCDLAWNQVTQIYSDATSLAACSSTQGQAVVQSLMNLDGLTIDNNGETMTPCIETRCDDHYVYVATNALPAYDFVATTPNPLNATTFIYRLAYTQSPIGTESGAQNAAQLTGCEAAYSDYVSSSPPQQEPSGFCGQSGYIADSLASGEMATYQRIPCLGQTGFMISGPPTFGPNEALQPDPFGNPAYYWPALAGETYIEGAALDLCGGHTSPQSMHYHGVNEACFARDSDGKPANSYVAATENWNFLDLIDGDCTTPSGIVGWSFDGYPIRGPCVCTERNQDGSCATVKRARSSWAYKGLSSWASGTPSSSLSKEGTSCTQLSDCCPSGGTCNYKCSFAVFDDSSAAGGSSAGRRCVLLDYSWCANRYVDRSQQDVSAANFVYMDRCNGFEGPDGYSYYATGSFPFLTGCYHGTPSDSVTNASLSGGMGMGPPGGGMGMGPPDGGRGPPGGGPPFGLPDGGPPGGGPPGGGPPDGGMGPPSGGPPGGGPPGGGPP